MIPDPEYDQTRVEFEDEWSRSRIEDLLQTNHYPRARAERQLYERYLPKDQLILEAGCGLGRRCFISGIRIQRHRRGFCLFGS